MPTPSPNRKSSGAHPHYAVQRHVFATLLAACLATSTACRPTEPAGAKPPPPNVTVAHPVTHNVVEWDEYTGRLQAVEFVEVRARVSGLIVSAPFEEGALVDRGDVLAEIDVRPFKADLDAKLAAEAQATAQVRLAQIEFDRIESIPTDARSATEFDNAAATLQQQQANLAEAKANVEAARLNVEWCTVQAPIDGRVSRKYVTQGNLISGGTDQGTLLTTITSVAPIYCYVDADERAVLKYIELARTGKRQSARQTLVPCYMEVSDETGYPHHGVIDFVDNRVDPTTGTISARGVFANSDGWLLPGFFARLRVPGRGPYEAILVPDSAVTTDQNQKMLLVLGDDNVVQPRQVKLGALFGDLRAIESGITTKDRVIIKGLLQSRPGRTANPTEASIPLDALADVMTGLPKPTTKKPSNQPASPQEGSGP